MSTEYRASVHWTRNGAVFSDNKYSRAHRWVFDEGVAILASSDPTAIPPPLSRTDAVDPEEGLIAALAGCHMLFFLGFACKKGFVVDSYIDHPVGTMGKNERGKLYVAAVTLDPQVVFVGDKQPTPEDIARMHLRAHEECYIANSIRAEVTIKGIALH